MGKSTLFNILDVGLLHKWRERIEKEERETWLFENEQETLQSLIALLDENSKELLTTYSLAIENRLDDIHHTLKVKIFNLGVRIGMELERSFAEYDE